MSADFAAKLYGPAPQPANATGGSAPAAASTRAAETDDNDTSADEAATADEYVLRDEARGVYANTMRDIEEASARRLMMSSEEATANAEWSASVFDALEVSASDASYLSELAVGVVARGGASEGEVAQWHRQSLDVLAQDFGSNSERAVTAAQALVAKHPDVREWLAASGLGSHPVYVRTIAQTAWRMKNEGRL
jgi:hypothetical protein